MLENKEGGKKIYPYHISRYHQRVSVYPVWEYPSARTNKQKTKHRSDQITNFKIASNEQKKKTISNVGQEKVWNVKWINNTDSRTKATQERSFKIPGRFQLPLWTNTKAKQNGGRENKTKEKISTLLKKITDSFINMNLKENNNKKASSIKYSTYQRLINVMRRQCNNSSQCFKRYSCQKFWINLKELSEL